MTQKIEHVMLDLETLSTDSNGAIVAIGAVKFDENGSYDDFYTVIDLKSAMLHDAVVDADTITWWMGQKDAARNALFSKDVGKQQNYQALCEFALFLDAGTGPNKAIRMWGNGSDFDCVMLANTFKREKFLVPWEWYNNRCYRTMKNIYKDVKMKRVGTHHNALDDAKSQVAHLLDIAFTHNLELK